MPRLLVLAAGHTETHYLRVYASQIRKKLSPIGAQMLLSEPGIGDRLLDPSEE